MKRFFKQVFFHVLVTRGLGLAFISFIHLVSHALFKRCLIMQVGYIIHRSCGQHDGRGYGFYLPSTSGVVEV